MKTKHIAWAFAAALALLGCDRCYALRVTSANGESHRLSQSMVRTYGCESFAEVRTTDDLIAWCEERELGDTVSADVAPGCRPGESAGGCERFWVCE
jgi:hypothetical protein